jgi:hypothetical protein
MLIAFLVCLAGMAMLWVTLVRFEIGAKMASGDLGRLRRALLPDDESQRSSGRSIAPEAASPATEGAAS